MVTSKEASDRIKWQKVFNALVEMLGAQQSQLVTLASERKLLEDRLKMQHRRWGSDVRFLNDQISRLKGDLKVQDMAHSLEAAKLDLAVGLKQREALVYKSKLGQADDDLADFRVCLDILTQKCSQPEESARLNQSSQNSKRRGVRGSDKECAKDANELQQRTHVLEDDLKKLRLEHDKLVSEKNYEVSALLSEKKFVWNQYNMMEANLNDKLKSKVAEVKLANEKISELLANMEKLQMENGEKDSVIAKLQQKIDEMETILGRRNEEITKIAQESDLLRRSIVTPVFSRCTSANGTSKSEDKRSGANKHSIVSERETVHATIPDSARNSDKGGRSSKRKSIAGDSMQDTPKLFSSSFKVPKLKPLSAR